jgi:hypothetical protein
MRHSIGLAWIAGFLIASAAPLQAQTTIQKARDILNDRTPPPPPPRVETPRVETTRRTTVIVPQRQIIVVDRVQGRRGWWNHPRYRVITVYYDGQRFYRQPFDRRPLRKVMVYVSGGRYYIDEVQWRRDHRRHYGRDYRWSDDDKRGHDDNWKDDDRRRDDDRWNDDDDRDESKGNNGRHLGRGHDKDKDKDKDKD